MYAQSLSFSPKNSSVSKNEFTFQNLSNIDWRVFADKIRQYVTKLNILLNQKLNQTETTMSQDKNTNEFKQLTWSKVKFSKNLSQLVENKPIIEFFWCMFGDQSGCDAMLQRVHQKQYQFYCNTSDEYRGYSEVQSFIKENKVNDAFNESDSHEKSEQEYMKVENQLAKSSSKQENFRTRPRSNIKQYERLFSSDQSRLNTNFIKMSKIIKDSGRVEFDNQMFNEVFEAVCHPESIKYKKKEIFKILDCQVKKIQKINSRISGQTPRQNENLRAITPSKSITMDRRKLLKSASSEKSRLIALRENANTIYKEIAKKRLRSARQGIVKKRITNNKFTN